MPVPALPAITFFAAGSPPITVAVALDSTWTPVPFPRAAVRDGLRPITLPRIALSLAVPTTSRT
jgi:hypothetical protein